MNGPRCASTRMRSLSDCSSDRSIPATPVNIWKAQLVTLVGAAALGYLLVGSMLGSILFMGIAYSIAIIGLIVDRIRGRRS
jgi:hypothetical protein